MRATYQRILGLLVAYLKKKSSSEQEKRIHYWCEGRIEKSVPRDHYLSSLGTPRDAKW